MNINTNYRSPRWELALRLNEHNPTASRVLGTIYDRVITDLQTYGKIHYTNHSATQVWRIIQAEFAEELTAILHSEFCKRILSDFNDDEIEDMLKDKKSKDVIENTSLRHRLILLKADKWDRYSVNKVLEIKYESRRPAIIAALAKEGVITPLFC